jgi:hypothetical protein
MDKEKLRERALWAWNSAQQEKGGLSKIEGILRMSIEEERERCAKILDEEIQFLGPMEWGTTLPCVKRLAKAIRSGDVKKRGKKPR